MALLFQIEDAIRLGESVWRGRLTPSELQLLAPETKPMGDITVVLLSKTPRYDSIRHQIAFDPSTAKLLNVGTSDDTVFVGSIVKLPTKKLTSSENTRQIEGGDDRFLSALPAQLRELGKTLLKSVRVKFPGELSFYEASGKYVDTPDNFWTIRPQPRDESFRITVRGRPETFSLNSAFEIKPDMTGYSSFKIERIEQMDEFVALLAQVRRK